MGIPKCKNSVKQDWLGTIFKWPLQLSIKKKKKTAQSLSLNHFLRLYSDLAEMHNILNTEEGNIISWKSWNFFKAYAITVIPAMPLNSLFLLEIIIIPG